jgi:peptidoglycan/xylan/chitin deacetylase (PgdA/CDA1 family)
VAVPPASTTGSTIEAAPPLSTTGSTVEAAPPLSTTSSTVQAVKLDFIPPPHPGPPQTVYHAPAASDQIALTIDDGYCKECVDAYVAFAQQSGIHLTFSPNGVYHELWEPHAVTLRPLIEAGQVQIGNHTYTHRNLTWLSSARVRAELERNDEWIEETFGITARPWYRPPYGFHNFRTDTIAAELGYTKVLMWNGTFGDATVETPQQLIAQAVEYLKPGSIVLGHANHPTVVRLLGPIQDLIVQRGLKPVTLDEMFGTSRAIG